MNKHAGPDCIFLCYGIDEHFLGFIIYGLGFKEHACKSFAMSIIRLPWAAHLHCMLEIMQVSNHIRLH